MYSPAVGVYENIWAVYFTMPPVNLLIYSIGSTLSSVCKLYDEMNKLAFIPCVKVNGK